jgi:hypothetical protein
MHPSRVKTLSTQGSNDDLLSLTSPKHQRFKIEDPDIIESVGSASRCFFDINLSRSETAREGKTSATSRSSNVCVALTTETLTPCRPSLAAFCLQSLKKHPFTAPAFSCLEVIFNAFLISASSPADLARRFETRCSVLGSPYLRT